MCGKLVLATMPNCPSDGRTWLRICEKPLARKSHDFFGNESIRRIRPRNLDAHHPSHLSGFAGGLPDPDLLQKIGAIRDAHVSPVQQPRSETQEIGTPIFCPPLPHGRHHPALSDMQPRDGSSEGTSGSPAGKQLLGVPSLSGLSRHTRDQQQVTPGVWAALGEDRVVL